jgi:hypothetical protein
LNWFEKNFGEIGNFDDIEFYFYNITDPNYRIWATANLFFGMKTSSDTFDQMYSIPIFDNQPQLNGIDYPRLHVAYAQFDKTSKIATFTLKTDSFEDVIGTRFNLSYVDSFKSAVINRGKDKQDITRFVKYNSIERILQFNNINVTHDKPNIFLIQL